MPLNLVKLRLRYGVTCCLANTQDNVKQRARILVEEFEWDISDARKVWTFEPNILVDCTWGEPCTAYH